MITLQLYRSDWKYTSPVCASACQIVTVHIMEDCAEISGSHCVKYDDNSFLEYSADVVS
jgi:hypothetical protein